MARAGRSRLDGPGATGAAAQPGPGPGGARLDTRRGCPPTGA